MDSRLVIGQRIVEAQAARFARPGNPQTSREELISAGNLGLAHALAKDDGSQFEAYCKMRVRGAIIDHLHKMGPQTRYGEQREVATGVAEHRDATTWERATPRRKSIAELTARELRVCMLGAEGMRNKAIAAELGVAVKTVDTQMCSIYRKLCVHNRAQLVRLVLESGMLNASE